MTLAAIYIPRGVLTYIFGDNHEGITINLGGKYYYKLEETDEKVSVKEKSINKKFIDRFWNKIKLISAIVGENGTGKTSILNLFKNADSRCLYIFEHLEKDEPTISENYMDVIYYSAFLI